MSKNKKIAIGAIIIGNEILTGKKQDGHFQHLQKTLAHRGLELSWSMILGDDAKQLTQFFRFSFSLPDIVFSFGGIGATPDDVTRQSVANALSLALAPHPEAIAEIEAQFGERAYPHRVLMANFPVGSSIIPNPINRVAGFFYQQHHFLPGFPEMAWPMVDWVLQHRYPTLRHLAPEYEETIFAIQAKESDLLTVMQQLVTTFPHVALSCLPHLNDPPFLELTLRGETMEVKKAMLTLKEAITEHDLHWQHQLE